MSGWKTYAYLILAAVLGTATIWTGISWLVPLAQTGLAYPVLYRDLKAGRFGPAITHMLFWAVIVSLTTIQFAIHQHEITAATILRGEPYRVEMFGWIETGIGAEGSPRQFIPEHLRHYGTTLLVSALSFSAAGLFLGSILLDYMNYYVGSLILMGSNPGLASVIGWPIWSMVRVGGFICGAIAMGHLGMTRGLRRGDFDAPTFRRVMIWSVALFLGDIILKATLAPSWREMLQKAL